jgi:glutamate racemase
MNLAITAGSDYNIIRWKERKGSDSMDKMQPIGVFDSGLGGISVLREIVRLMPDEDYVYYGDSANAPYGSRTTEEIRSLTDGAVQELIKYKVKAIVIACNTASSAAGNELRHRYQDLPIVCIEPALKPAVLKNRGGAVVVLATEATLREAKFRSLMQSYQDKAEIIKLPLPGLPEFVERGELHSAALQHFLQQHFSKLSGRKIGSIVLGCTHYPFVRSMIAKLAGPEVQIFDGAAGTARQLRRKLFSHDLLKKTGPGHIIWRNSATEPSFIERSKQLFLLPR